MKNINKKCINTLRTRNGSYMQHSTIPDLSINGSKPFTVEIFFGLLNINSKAALYRQEGVFEIGVDEGCIYFESVGFCSFKTDSSGVILSPNQFYSIAVVYDGTNISLFIQGYKILTKLKGSIIAANNNYYDIGKSHDGYITTIRVMDIALDDAKILTDAANPLQNSANCVAWLDFSDRQPVDHSKNNLSIWPINSISPIVNLVACTEFMGTGCCLAENSLKNLSSYTILGKIYPFYNNKVNMCVYYNAKDDKTGGFQILLHKNGNNNFNLVFSAGTTSITSAHEIETDYWFDFAVTISGTNVTLYVDGVQDTSGTITTPLSGREYSIIGTKYMDGRPDYTMSFQGYMDYIAEFEDVLTLQQINEYIENPPFIFDKKILSNMYMSDPYPNDIVYDKPLAHIGDVKFIFAEKTNPLHCEKGTSFYVPTTEDPVWATLSREEQWELETSCKFADTNREMVYGVATVGVPELFKKAASTLRRRAGGVQRPIPQNGLEMVEMAAQQQNAGVAVAANTGIAGFASCFGYGSCLKALACAIPLIAIPTVITAIVIEQLEKRPASTKVELEIISLQFNHDGNVNQGSIHFRNNADNAPDSTEYNVNAASGQINMQGVFVPKLLTNIKLIATVKLKPNSTSAITTTLQAKELNAQKALGDVSSNAFTISIGETKTIEINFSIASIYNKEEIDKKSNVWKWTYYNPNTGIDEFIVNSTHDIYTILDTPKLPWKYIKESYNKNNIGYIWTDVLDLYKHFKLPSGPYKDIQIIIEYITKYLNGLVAFEYDTIKGASFYTDINRKVKMKKFLMDKNSAHKKLNCTDCANLVAALAAAFGIDCYTIILMEKGGFLLNEIIPIGKADWMIPFNGGFSYHEIVVAVPSISSADVKIFDACLKIDTGDYPGKSYTSVIKKEQLPTNYAFTETSTPYVDVPVSVPYKKSFYRERLVKTGEYCNIGLIASAPVGITVNITKNSKEEIPMEYFSKDSSIVKYKQELCERFHLDIPAFEEKYNNRSITYIPDFSKIDGIHSTILEEDMGLEKIWQAAAEDGQKVTVGIYNTNNVKDALEGMLEILSKISNPDMKRTDNVGDISFDLANSGTLFVRNTIVVYVYDGNHFGIAHSIDKQIRALPAS